MQTAKNCGVSHSPVKDTAHFVRGVRYAGAFHVLVKAIAQVALEVKCALRLVTSGELGDNGGNGRPYDKRIRAL